MRTIRKERERARVKGRERVKGRGRKGKTLSGKGKQGKGGRRKGGKGKGKEREGTFKVLFFRKFYLQQLASILTCIVRKSSSLHSWFPLPRNNGKMRKK